MTTATEDRDTQQAIEAGRAFLESGQPGSEINAAIAAIVGVKRFLVRTGMEQTGHWAWVHEKTGEAWDHLPRFSSEWDLAEWAAGQFGLFASDDDDVYLQPVFGRNWNVCSHKRDAAKESDIAGAKSLPLAICAAIIKLHQERKAAPAPPPNGTQVYILGRIERNGVPVALITGEQSFVEKSLAEFHRDCVWHPTISTEELPNRVVRAEDDPKLFAMPFNPVTGKVMPWA